MLTSVAEFYEDDVNTRMTASLALIEPAIMIFMGIFVAFVLIALYSANLQPGRYRGPAPRLTGQWSNSNGDD